MISPASRLTFSARLESSAVLALADGQAERAEALNADAARLTEIGKLALPLETYIGAAIQALDSVLALPWHLTISRTIDGGVKYASASARLRTPTV